MDVCLEPSAAPVVATEGCPSTQAVEDVRALLGCGVPLEHICAIAPHGLNSAQIRQLAKEWVTSSGANPKDVPHNSLQVAEAVLKRGISALQDKGFCDVMLEGLEGDAPEELKDPLFYTLMKDPVVLSSGVVMDRSNALDAEGRLRFHLCPFTRESLKADVYPLLFLREKLVDFVKTRLEQIFNLIETAMGMSDSSSPSTVQCIAGQDTAAPPGVDLTTASKAVQIGQGLLKEIGKNTYFKEAERLAQWQLRILRLAGDLVPGTLRAAYYDLCDALRHEVPLLRAQKALDAAVGEMLALAQSSLSTNHVEQAESWLVAAFGLATDLPPVELSGLVLVHATQLFLQTQKVARDTVNSTGFCDRTFANSEIQVKVGHSLKEVEMLWKKLRMMLNRCDASYCAATDRLLWHEQGNISGGIGYRVDIETRYTMKVDGKVAHVQGSEGSSWTLQETDQVAQARTAVYLALTKTKADKAEIEAFLSQENMFLEDLRMLLSPPCELRVARKDDSRSMGDWQMLGQLRCDMVQITGLRVSCRWKDQGWGNTKGRVRLVLSRHEQAVCTEDLFGVCHEGRQMAGFVFAERVFSATDQIVSLAMPGDMCEFTYSVGGGGGHALFIRDFVAQLIVEAPAVNDIDTLQRSVVELPPICIAPLLREHNVAVHGNVAGLDGLVINTDSEGAESEDSENAWDF